MVGGVSQSDHHQTGDHVVLDVCVDVAVLYLRELGRGEGSWNVVISGD